MRRASLLLSLLLTTSVFAADVKLAPATWFALPNGVRAIVQEGHSQPVAAVEMWLHVGSSFERSGETGIAHLVEHALPWGDRVWSNKANVQLFRATYLDGNGQTRNDYTRYYSKVRANGVELILALDADRLTSRAAVDQKSLDANRDTVFAEWRSSRGRPWDPDVTQTIDAALWGGEHPYGHPAMESEADLKAVTPATLQRFIREQYVGANVLLIVTGDVDAETVKRYVAEYFAAMPAGSPAARPKFTAEEPARFASLKAGTPRVIANWRGPAWGDPDQDLLAMLLDVVAQRVGGGAHSVVNAGELGSHLRVEAPLDDASREADVSAAVARAVAAVIDREISASELHAAKARAETKLVASLVTLAWQDSRTELLGEGLLFRNDPDYYRVRLERIGSATAADLRSAARRWLAVPPTIAATGAVPSVAPAAADFGVAIPAATSRSISMPHVEVIEQPRVRVGVVQRRALPFVEVAIASQASLDEYQKLAQRFGGTANGGDGSVHLTLPPDAVAAALLGIASLASPATHEVPAAASPVEPVRASIVAFGDGATKPAIAVVGDVNAEAIREAIVKTRWSVPPAVRQQ